jgi:hypothetical protein
MAANGSFWAGFAVTIVTHSTIDTRAFDWA